MSGAAGAGGGAEGRWARGAREPGTGTVFGQKVQFTGTDKPLFLKYNISLFFLVIFNAVKKVRNICGYLYLDSKFLTTSTLCSFRKWPVYSSPCPLSILVYRQADCAFQLMLKVASTETMKSLKFSLELL